MNASERVLVTGGSGFIGTNLIRRLTESGYAIVNFDIAAPVEPSQRQLWKQVDIADAASFAAGIDAAKPDFIVHLAALADFAPEAAAFFGPNVQGTAHVLDAAKRLKVRRTILASTQYVNGPGLPFDDDRQYHPVNAYGESKVAMEKLAWGPEYAALDWVIIRPTNVWGPYHPRFPDELWRYIKQGFYMHPAGAPIVRAYGYVGNVVRQIELLLHAPADLVRHRVLYVGEAPIDSSLILDAFSVALRGKPVRRVPRSALALAAKIGDAMRACGLKAPFFSDRYLRMTTDHLGRDEPVWPALGHKAIPLEEAVAETVAWLRRARPDIYAR